MTKPQWTPGPWTWSMTAITRGSKKGKDVRRHLWTGVPGSGTILIPSWSEFDGGLWEAWLSVGDANAHLIAAAPDLYDALLQCQEYLKFNLGSTSDINPYPAMDAALAKARGEA